MFKLSYLIFRTGHTDYIPLPVTGSNGHNYGHAIFEKAFSAHVFRFTKEQWEGDKGRGGACEHMLKRNNRGAGVWGVLAEVEFDAESEAGQVAAELDKAKSDLETMGVDMDGLRAERDSLAADLATLSALMEGKQANAELPPPPAPPAEDAATPPAPPEEKKPEPPEPDGIPLNLRLAKLSLALLGEEMKEQMATNGAEFDLEALNTRSKRCAALLEWYKSRSQT